MREHRTGSIPVTGTIGQTEKTEYRGVEQLVARRAHNPEVVRFKSHPRNQRKEHRPWNGVLFFEYGGNCTARATGYEPEGE